MIQITEDQIARSEHLLLPHGMHFDEERRTFIKNLESRDLIAVPGSGKTTALLSKLFCLDEYLPFKDGSGILVLSHTNAAVDNIRSQLEEVCPRLFLYPNFVGTVQGFVDTFLVDPFYRNQYKTAIRHIDDEVYNDEVRTIISNCHLKEIFYFRCYFEKSQRDIFNDLRFWFNENGQDIISDGISSIQMQWPIPKKWKRGSSEEAIVNSVISFIFNFKKNLLRKGILCYDDCYYLANKYMQLYPLIIKIIQSRFKFVFIDETQDLLQYQIDILDGVFSGSSTIIQRIGDVNQSIYSYSSSTVACDWHPNNPLSLSKSMRLTEDNATIVNYFMLSDFDKVSVLGMRKLEVQIPPYLILFDASSKERLKNEFAKIISMYDLDKQPEAKYGFHIIGWNAKSTSDDERPKYRLANLFKDYAVINHSNDSTPCCLSDYLNKCLVAGTFAACKKIIIDSLYQLLNILGFNRDSIIASPRLLLPFFRNNYEHLYSVTNVMIYQCSFNLLTNNMYRAYDILKEYVLKELQSSLKLCFNEDSTNFIGAKYTPLNLEVRSKDDAVVNDIDIGTVHSAKGQTHCATMYVETFYHKYETQHLNVMMNVKQGEPVPLFKERANYGDKKNVKKAMRMMYVGFSRPTHLLCFATFKDNWDIHSLDKAKAAGWEIDTELLEDGDSLKILPSKEK